MNTHARKGQALAEFAIVLPFLLVLLLGIVDGARAIFASNGMSHAARDVARVAAVTCFDTSTTCANPKIEASKSLQAIQLPAGATWTVRCLDPVTLSPPSRPCRPGDLVEVGLTSTLSMLTPIVGQLIGPIDMTSSSRMEILQ